MQKLTLSVLSDVDTGAIVGLVEVLYAAWNRHFLLGRLLQPLPVLSKVYEVKATRFTYLVTFNLESFRNSLMMSSLRLF